MTPPQADRISGVNLIIQSKLNDLICFIPKVGEIPEVWYALQQETWGKVPPKWMESEQVIILFVLIPHNNRIDGDAAEAQATYEWTRSAIALGNEYGLAGLDWNYVLQVLALALPGEGAEGMQQIRPGLDIYRTEDLVFLKELVEAGKIKSSKNHN